MQISIFEYDIQQVRDGLLSDYLHIARRHQLFQADNPVQHRHLAITEMQQYAGQLKSHPAYRRFCDKFHLDYDEFIDNILQQAVKQLLPV